MDGFVFCSDTEGSSTNFKAFRRKVLSPVTGRCRWIYTGAGDADFLDMAARKIEERVRATKVDSIDGFTDIVEDVIVSVYERNIAAYPDDEKPSFSMIIGVAAGDRTELLRTNVTSVVRGASHECVGIGSPLGKFIIDKLESTVTDSIEATIISMYMLQQVRRYAPNCGGFSQVFRLLTEEGLGVRYFGIVTQTEIEAWESFFVKSESLARRFVIGYNHDWEPSRILNDARKLLRSVTKLPKPYT